KGEANFPAVTATLWRPGVEPELLPLDAATTSAGVLVLRVDADLEDTEAVHGQLRRICGDELTFAMVSDLLDPDELPEVKEFTEDGRLRKVSSFGVRELEDAPDSN